jgi:FkbM family methyltransferase
MKLTNIVSQTFKGIIPYTLKTFYKKNFRKFNGLKKIDEKMLRYINYNNGYFIEMGAHDGVHNSNTLYYEKYKNWHGLLIEPSLFFSKLINNRSKKNKFFNNGCSEFNGKTDAELLGSGDYSTCKDLVDQKYLDWHSKKQKDTKKNISITHIKLKTLNSILIESAAPKLVDFFSLDVEGMEMKVLRGIDFDYFNFKYLLVECVDQNKFEEINKFLLNKNYKHIDTLTGWDYLFKFENEKQ